MRKIGSPRKHLEQNLEFGPLPTYRYTGNNQKQIKLEEMTPPKILDHNQDDPLNSNKESAEQSESSNSQNEENDLNESNFNSEQSQENQASDEQGSLSQKKKIKQIPKRVRRLREKKKKTVSLLQRRQIYEEIANFKKLQEEQSNEDEIYQKIKQISGRQNICVASIKDWWYAYGIINTIWLNFQDSDKAIYQVIQSEIILELNKYTKLVLAPYKRTSMLCNLVFESFQNLLQYQDIDNGSALLEKILIRNMHTLGIQDESEIKRWKKNKTSRSGSGLYPPPRDCGKSIKWRNKNHKVKSYKNKKKDQLNSQDDSDYKGLSKPQRKALKSFKKKMERSQKREREYLMRLQQNKNSVNMAQNENNKDYINVQNKITEQKDKFNIRERSVNQNEKNSLTKSNGIIFNVVNKNTVEKGRSILQKLPYARMTAPAAVGVRKQRPIFRASPLARITAPVALGIKKQSSILQFGVMTTPLKTVEQTKQKVPQTQNIQKKEEIRLELYYKNVGKKMDLKLNRKFEEIEYMFKNQADNLCLEVSQLKRIYKEHGKYMFTQR